ncbi:probable 2-oxoglutarate-dependent dioxygenase AOP1 [Arachis stenosperma]|uniref:probable 2-oxoglutarate-dependent dioxygenase AOP1 n=1 Tax=Arachis stenosperma TaxID=217475 RepID=UPI0025AC8D43|nr:probable 2-oxoglutarate-dependent dioxygenase AOP1 [Arachis stenosperma]
MNYEEHSSNSQVPIINFSDENLKPRTENWDSACQVIKEALEDHGCFYALSYKVPMELNNKVFGLMEELFDLPLETKMQKISDKPYHGYYGPHPSVPLYESLGIPDPLTMENVQHFTKVMWPQGYHHFSETLNVYANLVVELDHIAKRMVCDGYGLEERHYHDLIESTSYLLRSFRYALPKKDESNLGLMPHKDTSFFTILHQNNVTGLQVKLKNGEWFDIDPSPFMFLILAGESFQVWSNDRIQACEHRIIINEKKHRFSMGLFSLGTTIQPHQELVDDEEHPRHYKPFNYYDYLNFVGTKEALESKCRIKTFCGID